MWYINNQCYFKVFSKWESSHLIASNLMFCYELGLLSTSFLNPCFSYRYSPPRSRLAAGCLAGCPEWRQAEPVTLRPGCWQCLEYKPSVWCSSPACTCPSARHTSALPPEHPSRPDKSYNPSPSTQLQQQGPRLYF